MSADYSETLDKELTASGLLTAFAEHDLALPTCFNPMIRVTSKGSAWEIERETTAVSRAGLGYSAFGIGLDDGSLDVAGTRILVIQQDEQGQLSLAEFDVRETKLDADSLSDDTVCPNQKSYKANVEAGASWKEMMTAPSPPTPPDCIPSPTRWCD